MVQVKVDKEKCNGCGTCVEVCPVSVFELKSVGDKKLSTVANNDVCIACRACEVQCETQAITIVE